MSKALSYQQQRQFEKLSREFDAREYAKALRTADGILSVSPDHADTMALKGVTLHNMNRKEEGYAMINKALAITDSSTLVWHSLGMCHRSDNMCEEALSDFYEAFKHGPTNTTVLRDISSLCIQLRDWQQFVDAREKMIKLKSGVRANWIALSCGHRMLGHMELAAATIDVMVSLLGAGENSVEKSEVYLYHIELEIAQNAGSRALELLKKYESEITDEYAKLHLRAKIHTLLGQKGEAEKRYMELIGKGMAEADCVAAIAQLHKIPLDFSRCPKRDTEKYLEILQRVAKANPKSDYVKRQALECVPIGDFEERLREYALTFVKKMIPSLFSVLKSLYKHADRTKIIGEVFKKWENELCAGDFSSFDGIKNPTYILWIWVYLASHYCRTGQYGLGLQYIERAIDHTPTLDLLYLMKAKIQARNNQLDEAAASADMARKLDLQDKYLNGKAAKYFFRANRIAEGEERMLMFYKASVAPQDAYLTALESQCAWYEREVGDAYYRMGDYVSALANYLMYEEHHKRIHNELAEFHNYVFRRSTMRPWFDVLACDDNLTGNKFFQKLCPRIARTYMKVHEEGEEATRARHVPRPEIGVYSDPEEAKCAAKLRSTLYLQDIDLSEPLKKAERYIQAHVLHNALSTEAHLLALQFYTMYRKPLLVARQLLVLAKLREPTAREMIEDFEKNLLQEVRSETDPRVVDVVNEVIATALERLN
uniref:Uncharacterized protein TCIL3000_10_4810 n=1 Tax=Trypanosoma congolense (strain IL3000) TaxID=1068625 RepID=G0UWF2_TRYCI|nr:unnamed protein product [Trypanosoma congolense IL3000]